MEKNGVQRRQKKEMQRILYNERIQQSRQQKQGAWNWS